MPSKRTPWSGSRRGVDLPADTFGHSDPRTIAAGRRDASNRRAGGAGAAGPATDPGVPGPDRTGTVRDDRTRAAGRVPAGTGEPEPGGHPYLDGGVGPAYWGGHALLGLVLGIAVLLTVGAFYLGRATDPHAAGEPAITTFVAASPQEATIAPAPRAAPAEPVGPASPEVGAGFVFGKVRANSGGVLIVHSEITRAEVVVYSDSSTKLYVLIASDPAGIDVGAPVWIYGRKHADGSLTARTIAGISMHGNTK